MSIATRPGITPSKDVFRVQDRGTFFIDDPASQQDLWIDFKRTVPWFLRDKTELFRGAVVKLRVGLGDEEEAIDFETDLGWEGEEGCTTFDVTR